MVPFILNGEMSESSTNGASVPSENLQNFECRSPFHVMHADVRHTESRGLGYQDGYTTLEWFAIHQKDPYFMPFIDLRGHVFNNGKLAGNVGIGERTVIPSLNHIFGLYCYYDVRQEDHGLTVNQISPGIEVVGKRMEYRINTYFPVGKNESRTYGRKFSRFQGHQIFYKEKKKYAMNGVDGEVGVHITQSTNHDVYAGLGPYYLTASPFSAWGGKARLLWKYKEYISLEASYSYDHLFHNVLQGTIGFMVPFGSKLKRTGQNCPQDRDLALSRAAFAPYRFEIPVVKRHTRHKTAINRTTGQPWNVWFVNNLSNSLGTFESPFSTLLQAQNASGPNDIIYVFSGDGTTKGLDGGITLQNGQKLWGAGIAHELRIKGGELNIPAFNSSAPVFTNPNGTIITLANGNEISGLNLSVTSLNSTAIRGTLVNSLNMNHTSVTGTLSHNGIVLTGFGNFVFNQNQFSAPSTIFSNGINLTIPGSQTANIKFLNNTVTGYDDAVVVTAATNASSAQILAFGNTIQEFFRNGLYLNGVANSVSYILQNNIRSSKNSGGLTGGIVLGPSNSNVIYVKNNTISTLPGSSRAF